MAKRRKRSLEGHVGLWLALACAGCGPMLVPGDETSTTSSSTDAVSDSSTADPPTTGTETGSSPDPSDGGRSGFIDPTDMPSSFQCDPWTGEPCLPWEKCMPYANDGGNSWNATKCSPLSPNPARPGEPCTVEGSGVSGVDNCDASSMCWAVNPETGEGTCVAFCKGSEANPTCDDPCARCNLTGSGVLILCLPQCDPLAQDCPSGEACYGVGAGQFSCHPYAGPTDGGGLGDPCQYINVCKPGLFCANAAQVQGCTGSVGCCAPFCDLTAEDPCPGTGPNTECVPWFEDGQAPPDNDCGAFSKLGGCVMPS